ncbi:hypothetical protein M0Q97_11350 [Candidatus Dojkabacteria bacterium]|jgi:hypothetical protein|nr:hypothetical protein [Candidatus Dojkabacteria bacterium]
MINTTIIKFFGNVDIEVNYSLKDNFRKTIELISITSPGSTFNILHALSSKDKQKIIQKIRIKEK